MGRGGGKAHGKDWWGGGTNLPPMAPPKEKFYLKIGAQKYDGKVGGGGRTSHPPLIGFWGCPYSSGGGGCWAQAIHGPHGKLGAAFSWFQKEHNCKRDGWEKVDNISVVCQVHV